MIAEWTDLDSERCCEIPTSRKRNPEPPLKMRLDWYIEMGGGHKAYVPDSMMMMMIIKKTLIAPI